MQSTLAKKPSAPLLDINKMWLQCKEVLPEEFDLFFEYYYKQHSEKPKTITEANFEELIQIYEKALLEQIGYTEVPEVQSTSLRLEDNPSSLNDSES